MQTWLGFVALFVSFWGYVHFLHKNISLKQEFCPVITISVISCFIFLAGCFKLLIPAFFVVFILGFLLYFYDYIFICRHDYRIFLLGLRNTITPGTIVFIVISVFLIFRLTGTHINYFDNYSHWELIAKNLIYDSEFPDAADSIIEFKSYPVGTAVFIWYVCRIVGWSEGNALFAQEMINLASGVCIFAFVSNKNRMLKAATTVMGLLFVLGIITCITWLHNGINSLFVDRTLAALGIAAYAVLIYYRCDVRHAVISVFPLLSFLVCVKNSGWFLVITSVVLLIHITRQNRLPKVKSLLSVILVMVGPLILWSAWNAYIRIAYDELSDTPHAVSVSYYSKILSGRSADVIKTIVSAFSLRLLTQNLVLLWFFIMVLLLLLVIGKYKKEMYGVVDIRYTLVFVLSVYAAYNTVLLAMYVFSMPYEEAIMIDSYNRYIMTIDTYACGILVILVMRCLLVFTDVKEKRRAFKAAVTAIGYLLLPMHLLGVMTLIIPPQIPYEEAIAEPLRIAIDDYDLPQDQNVSYCLCLVDENVDYYRYHSYLAKTILYSANVGVNYLESPYEFNKSALGDYDYYILIESSVVTVTE